MQRPCHEHHPYPRRIATFCVGRLRPEHITRGTARLLTLDFDQSKFSQRRIGPRDQSTGLRSQPARPRYPRSLASRILHFMLIRDQGRTIQLIRVERPPGAMRTIQRAIGTFR